MDNVTKNKSVSMTEKGQLTVPAKLRKKFGYGKGVRFIPTSNENGDITFKKVPTEADWWEVLKKQPIERVVWDKKTGLPDKEKSPEFYDWWINE